jgi:hypothetical protein
MAVRDPLQKIKPAFYCGSPAVYRKLFRWSNNIPAKYEKKFFKAPRNRLPLWPLP